MRTQLSAFIEPERSPDGRLEVTGYGYGHYVGTPAAKLRCTDAGHDENHHPGHRWPPKNGPRQLQWGVARLRRSSPWCLAR